MIWILSLSCLCLNCKVNFHLVQSALQNLISLIGTSSPVRFSYIYLHRLFLVVVVVVVVVSRLFACLIAFYSFFFQEK